MALAQTAIPLPVGLPGVLWVLPDSYIDVKNKDYGGQCNAIDISTASLLDASGFFHHKLLNPCCFPPFR
jgi:hypothetical protein